MRLLGRGSALLLLLLAFAWLANQSQVQQWQLPAWLGGQALPDERLATAQPSPVYLLDKERWLEFVITGHGDLLKILSNAGIAESEHADPERIWNYALEYQLLDADGETLEQRVYHHRSKQTLYRAAPDQQVPATGQALGRYFYLNETVVPINSASLRIKISGAKRPLVLRMRLAQTGPGIEDVVARVYQPNPVPDALVGLAWQRLSVKNRERLARGSVYGAEELRQQEAGNLLRNRYLPVGPQGVRGEHYEDRVLYTFGIEETDLLKEGGTTVLPAGLYADDWLRAVISVPEGGARIALSFKPVNRIAPTDEVLLMRWFGRGIQQRSSERLSLSGEELLVERWFEGGIIEIEAAAPVVIQAQRLDDDGQGVIDQEGIEQGSYHLRGYLAGQLPLEYRIDHVDRRATPWRLDLRAFEALPDGSPQAPARQVRYELLGRQGQIVQRGRLDIDPAWSRYDRFSGDVSGLRMTEVGRYYFALPRSVARVRLYADTPALVTAFTRPADLQRRLRLPEDNFAEVDVTARQRAWFMVHPQEKSLLETEQRSIALLLQSRPPAEDSEIAAGRYAWQSFQPQGNWLGRYLLQPREAEAVTRDEALASIYRPVPVNTTVALQFRGFDGVAEVLPELIFIRDDEAPIEVKVQLDGVTVLNDAVAQARGVLRLPPVAVGKRELSIEAGGSALWLVNYAGAGETSYLKRLVQRLSGDELVFDFDKKEKEVVLSAQLFLPHSESQRSHLRVWVEGLDRTAIGPFRHWSFRDRLFDVRAPLAQTVTLLNAGRESVGDGQSLFVPMGSDLPNGRYRIHFDLDRGEQAYLAVYQLSPGSFDRRSFFFERMFGDGAAN